MRLKNVDCFLLDLYNNKLDTSFTKRPLGVQKDNWFTNETINSCWKIPPYVELVIFIDHGIFKRKEKIRQVIHNLFEKTTFSNLIEFENTTYHCKECVKKNKASLHYSMSNKILKNFTKAQEERVRLIKYGVNIQVAIINTKTLQNMNERDVLTDYKALQIEDGYSHKENDIMVEIDEDVVNDGDDEFVFLKEIKNPTEINNKCTKKKSVVKGKRCAICCKCNIFFTKLKLEDVFQKTHQRILINMYINSDMVSFQHVMSVFETFDIIHCINTN